MPPPPPKSSPFTLTKAYKNIHSFGKFSAFVSVLIGLFLIVAFQNCQQDIMTEPPPIGSTKATQMTAIEAYLLAEGSQTPDPSATPQDQFPINSQVFFKMLNPHTTNKFKWTLTRGFDSIANDVTNTPEYSKLFNQKGTYDLLVEAYNTEKDPNKKLFYANKRIFIGDCSHNLEIILSSGSLSPSGNPTFAIENATNLTNIRWRVFSGTPIESDTLTLTEDDLTGQSQIMLEVMATDISQQNCPSYRKKVFSIHGEAGPHFNYLKPVDPNYPVTLENNEIYKYKRTSTSKYLQLNITGPTGQTCEKTNTENDMEMRVTCRKSATQPDLEDQYLDQIDLGQEDLDKSVCDENLIKVLVFAEGLNEPTQGQSTCMALECKAFLKNYYTYCPANTDICYLGSVNDRPESYHCPVERAIVSIDPETACNQLNTCNESRPENSTCTADSNGCYEWSCDDGYHEAGNQCVSCPTQKVCDANNPNHSTCKADGNNCYEWSCDDGYHEAGNRCVSCPTEQTCDNNNPANSACKADGNNCYEWSCDDGYHEAGNRCVTCPTQQTCDNNNPANSTCTADGNNCYTWSCNTNYRRSSNSCVTCSTSNTCNANKPSNSNCSADGNNCYTWSCNTNYRRSSNSCVTCSTSNTCNANKPSNSNCSADGNNCYSWSCNDDYRKSGNRCVSCPSSTTCNTNNPSNSTCKADNNSCYSWECDTGYSRSGNSCVEIESPECPDINLISGDVCSDASTADKNQCCQTGYYHSDPADTGNEYRWTCGNIANNPTQTDLCIKEKNPGCSDPNDPNCRDEDVCNPWYEYPGPNPGGCYVGKQTDLRDTEKYFRWKCGQRICQRAKYKGVCHSHYYKYGCSIHTERNTLKKQDDGPCTNDPNKTCFKWQCISPDKGSLRTASCERVRSGAACRSTYKDGCREGYSIDLPDSQDHFKWKCKAFETEDEIQCNVAKTATALCHNTLKNKCQEGASLQSGSPFEAKWQGYWGWTCISHDNRSHSLCTKRRPDGRCPTSCTNGKCPDSVTGSTCAEPTNMISNQRRELIEENDIKKIKFSWYCVGGTRTECHKIIESKAECGGPESGPVRRNTCNFGNLRDIDDTNDEYKWQCVSRDSHLTTANCRMKKNTNPLCDNSQKNGCQSGATLIKRSASTSLYRWQCKDGSDISHCWMRKPVANCRTAVYACNPSDARVVKRNNLRRNGRDQYVWECWSGDLNKTCYKNHEQNVSPKCGVSANKRGDRSPLGYVQKCSPGEEIDGDQDSDEYWWRCQGYGSTSQTTVDCCTCKYGTSCTQCQFGGSP